jgi:hypothetical protein
MVQRLEDSDLALKVVKQLCCQAGTFDSLNCDLLSVFLQDSKH